MSITRVMIKQTAKKLIRNVPSGVRKAGIFSALYAQNVLAGFNLKRKTNWVCELQSFDPVGRLSYAEEVFNDYLHYAGLSFDALKGKRILEVGTGENFAVALQCLARGAEKVVSIDRFPSLLPEYKQCQIYRALVNKLGNSGCNTRDFIEIGDIESKIDSCRFQYLPLVAVESLASSTKERFDIILSRAVLEHIYNLPRAFASMDAVLAKKGLMIHEVDFRDHAIFSQFGLNPLTFLTYSPDTWYRATWRLGAPNRELENSYRELLTKFGYRYKVLKIHAVGSNKKFHEESLTLGVTHDMQQLEYVRSIRPKLADRYKNLSEGDLLTAGVFLKAEKLSESQI